MPINKPSLQPSQKIYTKKDFEDGKCTKEGLSKGSQPIDEKLLTPEQPVSHEEVVDEASKQETASKEQPKEATSDVSDDSKSKSSGGK